MNSAVPYLAEYPLKTNGREYSKFESKFMKSIPHERKKLEVTESEAVVSFASWQPTRKH